MHFVNVIIYIILGVILLLPLAQIVILVKANIRSKKKQSNSDYEPSVKQLGKNVMHAVENGTIKKQLLLNDAPEYDSTNALKRYVNFIEKSSIYKQIANIEDTRF
ncbi:hypothetical protein [Frisingicoccus sp.]|uniref:hypothetical protein n=1 Tax=Frisingicoccus sp. TaxID=1918627 RepID=UPI00399B3FDD